MVASVSHDSRNPVRGLALERGFTTIRDLETEGAYYADVAIRDAIKQGLIPGPRMFVVTRALDVTGAYPCWAMRLKSRCLTESRWSMARLSAAKPSANRFLTGLIGSRFTPTSASSPRWNRTQPPDFHRGGIARDRGGDPPVAAQGGRTCDGARGHPQRGRRRS